MNDPSYPLAVYLNLSRASERRKRVMVRDRMLVMAGMEAATLNLFRLSQYCRDEILKHNPRHLIGRWDSFASAMLDEEFLTFAKTISRRYPIERSEQMLESLGIDISNERATYYDDVEYAASILNVDLRLLSDGEQNDQTDH